MIGAIVVKVLKYSCSSGDEDRRLATPKLCIGIAAELQQYRVFRQHGTLVILQPERLASHKKQQKLNALSIQQTFKTLEDTVFLDMSVPFFLGPRPWNCLSPGSLFQPSPDLGFTDFPCNKSQNKMLGKTQVVVCCHSWHLGF